MRLPRLRAPWLAQVSEQIAASVDPRVAWYGLFAFVVFVALVVANFPYSLIVQNVLRSLTLGPVQVEVAETHFAWFRGFELRGVRLTRVGQRPDAPPLLEASRLYVRPALSSVLRLRLSSLRMWGTVCGGEMDGRFDSTDGTPRATVELRSWQVGEHPMLRHDLESGSMTGRLSGRITLEGRPGDLSLNQLVGELQVTDFKSDARYTNGDSYVNTFPIIAAKFVVRGETMDVQELRVESIQPTFKATVSGQITLRSPWKQSLLNLRGDGDAAFREVANLARGKRAKEGPITLTGTFNDPQFR